MSAPDIAGQNDVTIGRFAAAVTGRNGRESATDVVLTAVRQYDSTIDVEQFLTNVSEFRYRG